MEPGRASSPDESRAEPQSCAKSDFTKVEVREQGITVLYGGTKSLVDIVFIHGIQGHPRNTWAHGPDPTKPKNKVLKVFHGRSKAGASQIPSESVYWPADILPRDFKEARVLTYGYDSHVSRFFKGAANQNNISAHGRSLLHALELHRRDEPKRPLIFMVHSLGGIILKEALRRSKNAPEGDQDLRNIYESTNAIVFFGTPHRGSSYAKMGAVAEQIVKLIGFDANGEILRNLKPDGAHLELLREEFAYMLDSRTFKVYSFQEGRGFKGANVLSRKIVDDASSSLEHSVERKDYINANHMMMCRFASSDDEGYIKVKGILSKCLGEVHKINEEVQQELDRNLKEIRKGMNERQDQITVAHTHTFNWIFTDPNAAYIEWLQGDSGLFWINGKPGSGKSTLMKCILEDPRSRQALLTKYGTKSLIMPGFFFHDRGMNLTQKSIDGLFRSVLYQIVSDIPALAIPVHEVYKMAQSLEGRCEWRTTELKKALNAVVRQTQISGCIMLFIDALDEFIGRDAEIARFLKELISCSRNQSLQIRICASSRPHNVFQDMLGDFPGLAIHHWTAKDIDIYTSDRLGECKRDGLEDLHREITSRAEGVFLWVRLVIEELSQALFDGEPITALMEILSALPADLSDFYRRMIERLPSDKQTVMLQMLELVLCQNVYALRLIDLTIAVTMPPSGDPSEYCSNLDPHELIKKCREMERQLRGVSGGLLQVLPDEYFKSGIQNEEESRELPPDWVFEPLTPQEYAYSTRKIQFLHQTAKEFVSNPSNSDIMKGSSAKQTATAGTLRFMRLYTFLARARKRSILFNFAPRGHTRPSKESELRHTFVIDLFYTNARTLELLTENPNTIEIARFNDALCSCIGSRWPTEWVKSKSNAYLELAVLPTSTLSIAILEGLFYYAYETINDFEIDIDNPWQGSLLCWAVTAAVWFWYAHRFLAAGQPLKLTKCHEFATFLLKKGENPNATVVVPYRYWTQAGRPKTTPQLSEPSTNEGSSTVPNTERRQEEKLKVEGSAEISLLQYALGLLSWSDFDEPQASFLEMINVLISHGADVNQTFSRNEWICPEVGLSGSGPDIESALHFLLCQSTKTPLAFEMPISGPIRTRLIKSFLAHGADPNAVDSDGNTILERALPIFPPDIIELMLESGAKISRNLLGRNGAPVYKPVPIQPPQASRQLDSVSSMPAEGILDEMRWRRPEFYNDEAREIARSYNPHWAETEEIRGEKGFMGRIGALIGWAK